MSNYIVAIIAIIFVIYPSICFPSYLIKLKNGSAFITNHYWKDGRQIKFYYYGGVVGIENKFVSEIGESDLPYKKEIIEQVTSQTTKMTDEDIDIKFYKNAKKELMEKYSKAKNKLDKAIVDRNKIAKKEAKKELMEIHEKLSDISNALKSKNKGVLPNWW